MFGEKRNYIVSEEVAGGRLDIVLASLEKDISRQYFQKLIKDGCVFLGVRYLKPSYKVKTGDILSVDYPLPVKMTLEPDFEIALKIVYEDADLMVIDKQAGLVVHPAEHGRFMGKSLVNAALAHAGDSLRGIGGVMRPGIVHRLDKDTSGLIVVAKTEKAHQGLMAQFKGREVKKRYMALLVGRLPHETGRIEAPIGRDLVQRKKMAINGINCKDSITEFVVKTRFKSKLGEFTLVDVGLLTGRTHQIRVHFQSIGFPLAGDKTYGQDRVNKMLEEKTGLKRQFLHSYSLGFVHPVTQKKLDLVIDLADDLKVCLEVLK